MAHTKNSPARVKAADRAARAVELRKQGLTQGEIAKDLGVSQPSVSSYLSKAMSELMARKLDGAEELRAMELAVLMEVRDRALIAWARYEGENAKLVVGHGDLAHVESGEPIDAKGARLLAEVTKVSESIRKMLGLDAPQQVVSVSGSLDDMSREDAERLVAAMKGVETR